MDDLLSHPQVREYLALVRLQMLTPLSLLVNIASIVTCSFLPSTSLGRVSNLHPTALSPRPFLVAIYLIAIFAGQLGYCLLLSFTRNDETKKILTSAGTGFSLVLANWTMALWAIAWVLEWFVASAVLQGIILVLLLYANIMLLFFHPPTWKRPFDLMFIHAPLRFFLVLELALLFPLSLLVALGLEYTPSDPDPPIDYSTTAWTSFGILLGTNLVGLTFVVIRRDIVWAVAATWTCVSIWSLRPKPASVFITAVLFTALLPLVLVSLYVYSAVTNSGQVALPPDDHHPALYHPTTGQNVNTATPRNVESGSRGPREVDEDAVWG